MSASLAQTLPLHVLPFQAGSGRLLPSFIPVQTRLPRPGTLYTAFKATASKTFEAATLSFRKVLPGVKGGLGHVVWFFLNNLVLLRMGTTYKRRFEEFETISDDIVLVDQWRRDQQDEWNRLSTTLALLATMNTTILAISPQAPSLAFATWLGGAGLSVCGVFVVQYFSIKAFSVTDEDVGLVLQEDSDYASLAILASVIAGPVVIKLWSAVLFLIGTIDYILETEALSPSYKAVAFIPVLAGATIVLLAMVVGEAIDRKLHDKYRKE